MILFYIWCLYIIIGTILLVGKAITCRILGIYHKHYQIGYSPCFARFRLFDITFSIGIIIPLPWLFKRYEIRDNVKQQITPIWMRREFPVIKRIIGILGGVTLLYLISITLYALNFHTIERTYLSTDEVNKKGVYVDSLGIKLGLRTGDKIIKINGEKIENFSNLKLELYSDNLKSITVFRKNSLIEIELNKKETLDPMYFYENQIIYPITFPLKVDSVLVGHNAYNAGLVKGDLIVTLNQDTIYCDKHLKDALKRNINSKAILGINRNGQNSIIFIEVDTDLNGRIGVIMEQGLAYSIERKSFLKSLNSGNIFIIDYIQQFKKLFIGDSKLHKIGGFQTIGNLFPPYYEVWRVLSMLLLIYICWSIIPTPITESRYFIALLLDKVISLPRNAATWIGWIIFLSFILIANAIDIFRILF